MCSFVLTLPISPRLRVRLDIFPLTVENLNPLKLYTWNRALVCLNGEVSHLCVTSPHLLGPHFSRRLRRTQPVICLVPSQTDARFTRLCLDKWLRWISVCKYCVITLSVSCVCVWRRNGMMLRKASVTKHLSQGKGSYLAIYCVGVACPTEL